MSNYKTSIHLTTKPYPFLRFLIPLLIQDYLADSGGTGAKLRVSDPFRSQNFSCTFSQTINVTICAKINPSITIFHNFTVCVHFLLSVHALKRQLFCENFNHFHRSAARG